MELDRGARFVFRSRCGPGREATEPVKRPFRFGGNTIGIESRTAWQRRAGAWKPMAGPSPFTCAARPPLRHWFSRRCDKRRMDRPGCQPTTGRHLHTAVPKRPPAARVLVPQSTQGQRRGHATPPTRSASDPSSSSATDTSIRICSALRPAPRARRTQRKSESRTASGQPARPAAARK